MRILIVADGQSPHARNWIAGLVARGGEVHLATTYPCEFQSLGVASCRVVPVDFSARVRASEKAATMGSGGGKDSSSRLRGTVLWKTLAAVRNALAPVLASLKARELRTMIDEVRPDIVHAMRIPFEGILAMQAIGKRDDRLAISTWGNDFSLYAASSPTIAGLTRRVVVRADALHSDCQKDVVLATEYGYDPHRPTLVAPGNGGVNGGTFHEGPADEVLRRRFSIDPAAKVVINARGLKPYVRNVEFLQAIPKILERVPNTIFLFASMEGKDLVEGWVERLRIGEQVRLLPSVSHLEMAGLFRLSDVAVSPSDHDGTPNTLLEAMACGAFPVAGAIPSIREWIEDGINGLWCDQTSIDSLADATVRALVDDGLRARARDANRELIATRADKDAVAARIDEFYERVAAVR